MIYWYWNILKYIVDRWIFSNSKNRRGHSYKGTMNRGNPLEVSPSISGSPWKIPWKNPTLGTLGFPVLGLKKTQLINIWRLENNPWIDQATRFFFELSQDHMWCFCSEHLFAVEMTSWGFVSRGKLHIPVINHHVPSQHGHILGSEQV